MSDSCARCGIAWPTEGWSTEVNGLYREGVCPLCEARAEIALRGKTIQRLDAEKQALYEETQSYRGQMADAWAQATDAWAEIERLKADNKRAWILHTEEESRRYAAETKVERLQRSHDAQKLACDESQRIHRDSVLRLEAAMRQVSKLRGILYQWLLVPEDRDAQLEQETSALLAETADKEE